MFGLGAAAVAAGAPLALLQEPIGELPELAIAERLDKLALFRADICREYIRQNLFSPFDTTHNGVIIRQAQSIADIPDGMVIYSENLQGVIEWVDDEA